MTDRTPIAAFDVDGTLTTRDSVIPFMVALAGRRRLLTGLATRLPSTTAVIARRDRDRLRELATQIVFRNRPTADVSTAAKAHAAAIWRDHLRQPIVARLAAHRDAGHRVVLVSASYEDYLRPLGERLGVHAVLGTRLERDGARCTGRLDGPNCRGPEKVQRLMAWLGEQGLMRRDVEMWAYGDSAGDRELLAWSDHPTWVGPGIAPLALPTPD